MNNVLESVTRLSRIIAAAFILAKIQISSKIIYNLSALACFPVDDSVCSLIPPFFFFFFCYLLVFFAAIASDESLRPRGVIPWKRVRRSGSTASRMMIVLVSNLDGDHQLSQLVWWILASVKDGARNHAVPSCFGQELRHPIAACGGPCMRLNTVHWTHVLFLNRSAFVIWRKIIRLSIIQTLNRWYTNAHSLCLFRAAWSNPATKQQCFFLYLVFNGYFEYLRNWIKLNKNNHFQTARDCSGIKHFIQYFVFKGYLHAWIRLRLVFSSQPPNSVFSLHFWRSSSTYLRIFIEANGRQVW